MFRHTQKGRCGKLYDYRYPTSARVNNFAFINSTPLFRGSTMLARGSRVHIKQDMRAAMMCSDSSQGVRTEERRFVAKTEA